MPSDLIDELQARALELAETIFSGIAALVTLCDEEIAVEERLASVKAAKGDPDRIAGLSSLAMRAVRDHIAQLVPDPGSFTIDDMFDAIDGLIAQNTKTTTPPDQED